MNSVYPTGDALIDQLTEFAAARLPGMHKPNMDRKASLREEWWLEEVGSAPCPCKEGWSFVYRFARDRAVERGEFGGEPANLLRHQLTELLPSLFAVTSAGHGRA